MNTKKIVIVTACAAVLVGSAFAFRKVKNEVTRILKAEEPKDDDRKSKFDDVECKRKYNELNDCAEMPEMPSDCCEACEEATAAVRPRHLSDSMAAMGSCCDMAPMGKARLVD